MKIDKLNKMVKMLNEYPMIDYQNLIFHLNSGHKVLLLLPMEHYEEHSDYWTNMCDTQTSLFTMAFWYFVDVDRDFSDYFVFVDKAVYLEVLQYQHSIISNVVKALDDRTL